MIVDIHTRVWHSTEQLGPAIAHQLRRTRTEPWHSTDATAAALDRATGPIEAAVIHGFESRRLNAQIPNELVADAVRRDPTSYLGFAGIDPTSPEAMQNLDRAVALGLVGVTISPALQGFHPSATFAMDFFEACAEHDLALMVEGGAHLAPQAMLEFAQPMLLDELCRTLPKLKVIIGSLGHPFVEQTLTLVCKHEHVYADIAELPRRPWELYNALVLAHQRQVTERLLFGSGFPFVDPQAAIMACYSVNSMGQGTNLPSVPREQIRTIVERDALSCLGLRDKLQKPGDASSQVQTPHEAQTSVAESESETAEHAQPQEQPAESEAVEEPRQ